MEQRRAMIEAPNVLDCPVFLVGAERSGTTLLRLMLDSHPEVAFAAEMEFVVTHLPDSGWPDMEEYVRQLRASRVFVDSGFSVNGRRSYCELMNSFLLQKLRRGGPGKRVVGGTVHYCFDRLLRIWPEARFIHLVRDPRDVARSVVAMGWAGNAWAGAQQWIEAEQTWDEMKKTLPAQRYVELRFEDLVRNPEAALTRVCGLLEVPYSPRMMDYAENSSYERPNPGLVEQWKRKMPREDVRLVESRVGELLQARRYERSAYPGLVVTPDLERRLRRGDRLGKIRFGLRRYGVGNMAASFLSRRLRLKAVERAVRIRRHAIDRAYIK
jgi:hypothetical protein